MGEGPRFPYPKQVWSPAGGWWPYPAKWRANTAATIVLIAAIAIPVAVFSEKNMITEGRPNRRIPWRPYLEPKEH
ncbi:hypothetical protein BWQ96_02561 [Gracilariopsis chorda]|uniref:Uncharacterized protein n=1 Tax=Gracilariopsis chorda TaxID=448386 RepID=A0A2V3J025_9FLOR|nr:hypothetical protein BWQ96_02561 [Gracilariopsis chorda]|eukprot:PXF47699.1 hypothetical protein BWQ96_02561 [Gracilariopsis chorda]